MEKLEQTQAGAETSLSKVFHELAESLKRRALVVVLSDLFDDPAEMVAALKHFRHKKHEVVVFQILDPAEVRQRLLLPRRPRRCGRLQQRPHWGRPARRRSASRPAGPRPGRRAAGKDTADIAFIGGADFDHPGLAPFRDPAFGCARRPVRHVQGAVGDGGAARRRADEGQHRSAAFVREGGRQGPRPRLHVVAGSLMDEFPHPAVVPAVDAPAGRLPDAGAARPRRLPPDRRRG